MLLTNGNAVDTMNDFLLAEIKEARIHMNRYKRIYTRKGDNNYIKYKHYESLIISYERLYNFIN